MNVEENRLQTFEDWPTNAAVSPERIAKAGFYSIKENLIVECFSCAVRLIDWNYGDQVMARHKLASPQCAFVLNPSTSGNVPIVLQNISQPDSGSPVLDLREESARLQTFDNWPVPHIVSPQNLAKAGFYYLKQSDKTKCAFCSGVVGAWELFDDPINEHIRHFPDCSFVISTLLLRSPPPADCPPAAQADSSSRNPSFLNIHQVSQDELQKLGVNTHKGPKKPKYAILETRLSSFVAWPSDLMQTPEMLAQAGFYYEGSGDQVRCFHCDGGLRHWDPQDDPWTEHARWFPKCTFVQLNKGQEFIASCAPSSSLDETSYKTRSFQRREISDREFQNQMTSAPALAALNVGLHVGRVKRAIREKLEQTGAGFGSADALIEAALNMQHVEDDEQNDTQISNEVTRLLSSTLEQALKDSSEKEKIKETSSLKTSKVEDGVCGDQSSVKLNKALSLEEENRILKEARLCKICMDAEITVVFLPCRHLATCVNCASNLKDCPVCRSVIESTVITYLP